MICRLNPDIIVLELGNLASRYKELEPLVSLYMPIIALGGARELKQNVLRRVKWTKVLKRPVSIGVVADTGERVIEKQ